MSENCEAKRRSRFTAAEQQQLLTRTLPDYLRSNLDIVIIGINPGLVAAQTGHHYAGPGNHFWKCLYLSGIVPYPFTAFDDYKMLDYGIGFTNMVSRTTRGSGDLKAAEIREGASIVRQKLSLFRPKIAVFNGKGIYETFAGRKCATLGKQPETIEATETLVFVMPSSSARCAQLPRFEDKLPFYIAIRKLRDFVTGRVAFVDTRELTFAPCGNAKAKRRSNAKDGESGERNRDEEMSVKTERSD
ncbi:G/T mismatch-specific thymine DNA glycosylase-like protein [Dinothrombium tinctorium]|uniref:G/T mismatch-specific thymine DNA glycosylase n=1 Tax=Dinothrombium tinctorium TaxID=1965070 RepID=A0A443R928_9ACAR|nr:G/T mismatch-specific thymine DNA glycosylase-like protein [Dinothrombium tinctorium]